MDGTGREAAGEGQRPEPSWAVPLPRGFSRGAAVLDPMEWWNSHCLTTTTVQGGGLGVVSGLGAAGGPEKAVGAGWQDQPGTESDKRLSCCGLLLCSRVGEGQPGGDIPGSTGTGPSGEECRAACWKCVMGMWSNPTGIPHGIRCRSWATRDSLAVLRDTSHPWWPGPLHPRPFPAPLGHLSFLAGVPQLSQWLGGSGAAGSDSQNPPGESCPG